MNTERLRELCDAADAGALRGEEMRGLVALAREAGARIHELENAVHKLLYEVPNDRIRGQLLALADVVPKRRD
jgi:hypothetical protein